MGVDRTGQAVKFREFGDDDEDAFLLDVADSMMAPGWAGKALQ